MVATKVSPIEAELAEIWDQLVRRVDDDRRAEFEQKLLGTLRRTESFDPDAAAAEVRSVLDDYIPSGLDALLATCPELRDAGNAPAASEWRDGSLEEDDVSFIREQPTESLHRETIDLNMDAPLRPSSDQRQVSGPAGSEKPDSLRRIVVPVWYATNRRRRAKPDGSLAEQPYGADIGEAVGDNEPPIYFGIAEISVPDNRAVGTLRTPRWWRLEFRANPEKHFYVYSTSECKDEDAWTSDLRTHVSSNSPGEQNPSDDDLLVYIHGYNTTWQADVERAAQLGLDLNFRGPVVSLSWPSMGRVHDYESDARLADVSRAPFSSLLRRLMKNAGAKRIFVVAHSLGNRIALQGLTDATSDTGSTQSDLTHVIFAAPDVDGDYFAQQMKLFAQQTKGWGDGKAPQLTLYACGVDLPLEVSRLLAGARRAGDARPEITRLFPPAEYIDATTVVKDDPNDDGWGHSYFCSNSGVLRDMIDALHGTRASERPWLDSVDIADGGKYFSMRGRN